MLILNSYIYTYMYIWIYLLIVICIFIYINMISIHSHVWMETPDANVQDARQFMDLVNEHLAPHGLFARYKCEYTYICVQIRIDVYVYMRILVHVFLRIYGFSKYTFSSPRTIRQVSKYIHRYIRIHNLYMCLYVYLFKYACLFMHIYIYIYSHMCIHILILIYI
jgi:hypothetical protein